MKRELVVRQVLSVAQQVGEIVSGRQALWNLHDAVMAGEAPADCPDCGADEWSPSAEAFETTGRIVCEDCADACMEQHNA